MFNKKIDFIRKKPFTLFKINNFFPEEFYKKLTENFPNIENFTDKQLDDFKNKKYAFDTSSELHKLHIATNSFFTEFEKLIFSKEFFNFFYKNLYFDFLKSRTKKPLHLIKLLKYPKVVKDINKKGLFYIISPFNKVKVEIQYSYILNGGKIVPHTDSGEKLLSLMLYFPLENFDIEKQNKLGTCFWSADFSNFDNYHQYDDKNLEDKKLLYKTPFDGNILYGFIKNHASWHSVDIVDIDKNFVRRSVNINFYF